MQQPYPRHTRRFDVLFHSTEGFISNKQNEMSKMVASEAIRSVSENLVTAICEHALSAYHEKLPHGAGLNFYRLINEDRV